MKKTFLLLALFLGVSNLANAQIKFPDDTSNDSFITHFFETSTLSSMTSAIDSGNVVVVRKNGHYMLVFGLQYDGDVIYADPHESGIYAVNESYFSGCDAFEIGGINQSQMRMLAQ